MLNNYERIYENKDYGIIALRFTPTDGEHKILFYEGTIKDPNNPPIGLTMDIDAVNHVPTITINYEQGNLEEINNSRTIFLNYNKKPSKKELDEEMRRMVKEKIFEKL